MLEKIETIEEGLEKITSIDLEMDKSFDTDDYEKVFGLLKERMALIAQMTKIRGKSVLKLEVRKRLEEITGKADLLQKKILDKKNNIAKRLGNKKSIDLKNRNIRY